MGSAAEGSAFGASQWIGRGDHRNCVELSRHLVIPHLGIQSKAVSVA